MPDSLSNAATLSSAAQGKYLQPCAASTRTSAEGRHFPARVSLCVCELLFTLCATHVVLVIHIYCTRCQCQREGPLHETWTSCMCIASASAAAAAAGVVVGVRSCLAAKTLQLQLFDGIYTHIYTPRVLSPWLYHAGVACLDIHLLPQFYSLDAKEESGRAHGSRARWPAGSVKWCLMTGITKEDKVVL